MSVNQKSGLDKRGQQKETRLRATRKSPAQGGSAAPAPNTKLLKFLIASLEDNKAAEIATIDLAGKTSIADFMIVASGTSNRQVAAISEHLLRGLKDSGYGSAPVEGLPQADWVLVDAGDVIVHIFRPEVRSFYNLEKMWSLDLTKAGRGGNDNGKIGEGGGIGGIGESGDGE